MLNNHETINHTANINKWRLTKEEQSEANNMKQTNRKLYRYVTERTKEPENGLWSVRPRRDVCPMPFSVHGPGDYGSVGFRVGGRTSTSRLQAIVYVDLTCEESEAAARHAADLSPYDHLASKVFDEEEELRSALRTYARACAPHRQNAAWSHVLSEAADVANTTAAWLLQLPARTSTETALCVWEGAYGAALTVLRATTWADRAFKVEGTVESVTEQLQGSLRPLARAIMKAAIAKTAEVSLRPHGVTEP